jgi:hypothetical protein
MIFLKMSQISNKAKTGLNFKISEIHSILNNNKIDFHLDQTFILIIKYTHSQYNQVKRVMNK